jgi:hypothetical protein
MLNGERDVPPCLPSTVASGAGGGGDDSTGEPFFLQRKQDLALIQKHRGGISTPPEPGETSDLKWPIQGLIVLRLDQSVHM